jgi:hypothetical protein
LKVERLLKELDEVRWEDRTHLTLWIIFNSKMEDLQEQCVFESRVNLRAASKDSWFWYFEIAMGLLSLIGFW